ncbi:35711_t:CDS:2, partial [Racocetra persica]
QDIPLAKLPYFVQISHELESPFIMESSITYENEKEISEAVSFGIMIDESTDISINKHLVIYVIYPNSSEIRLKKLKEVRWFGWYNAVKNFVKTLPAVLSQLKTND